jgi:two-component sensor histidine kinase
MQDHGLRARNAYLSGLLKEAGVDAARRDIAESLQTVLTEELHHRMKNMLAMVTSIIRQSMRSTDSMEEAEKAIAARLMAMGKAHDLLLEVDWKSAELSDVIKGAILQHSTDARRIRINGPDIRIASTAILPLTLMLNELCTNAAKYGALSNDDGYVELNWDRDPVEKRTAFKWLEAKGPPVLPAKSRSFGSRLLEEALPRQLGGRGQLVFHPSGAEFQCIVPDHGLGIVLAE